MIGALFVALFFSPLAFIHGRWRARSLKARHGDLKNRLTALLPIPLLFAVCGAVAIVWESEASIRNRADLTGLPARSTLDTGNGVLDALLTVARWLGQIELILFMVAIPYLMGAIVACILLVLDANGRIELKPVETARDTGPDEG